MFTPTFALLSVIQRLRMSIAESIATPTGNPLLSGIDSDSSEEEEKEEEEEAGAPSFLPVAKCRY